MCECKRWLIPIIVLVAAACQLTGCGGAADPGSAAQPLQEPAEGAPQLLELPAPSELAGQADAPRRGSYVEEGLIHHGKDYEGDFPKRNVSKVGETASFSPSWSPGTGLGPENLAFCIFEFSAEGFDREPQIRYGWEIAPAAEAKTYLALSSWESDSWEWFLLGPAGFRYFASLEPYISMTGLALAVVVQTGTEVSRLRYLRLGPQQLSADLVAIPATGISPTEVHLDATGSECPAGSVVYVEWDFDGNGSYDVSSGAALETDHTYAEVGQSQPRVRITSSYSVQATASAPVDIGVPWVHTWGRAGEEALYGIAHDGAESVFAVGSIEVFGNAEDLLLLKYNLDGNLIWARSWGGTEADFGRGVAVGADGALYVAGDTESYGAGHNDIFLQRWDADGNLVWTHTWGDEGYDWASQVAISGGDVYVLGSSWISNPPEPDILLLKYDEDGAVQWTRTVGDELGGDIAGDMHTQYHFMGGTSTIHVVGTTPADWPADESVLYVKFNDSGDLLRSGRFIGVINEDTTEYEDHQGTCIVASGQLDTQIYLGATRDRKDIVLLRVDDDGLVWSQSWNGGNMERATDLLLAGDRVVLCGYGIDGLLFRFSLDGNLPGVQSWDNAGGHEEFQCMTRYPGGGVLLGGIGAAAVGGNWSPPVGSTLAANGSWHEDESPEAPGEPDGITDDIPDAPVDITDGIIDTGGGGDDALLAATSVP